MTVDGSAAAPATADCASGAWTLTLTTPITADGSYVFAAAQTDAAGNTGTAASRTVTIDKTGPAVAITEVNGTTVSFPYVTKNTVTSVGGTCTTGEGEVSVTLDGTATVPGTANCASGAWTLTLTTPLTADGSYVFAASQTDAVGNTGTSGNTTVGIDTTGPAVAIGKVNGSTVTFPYTTGSDVTSIGGSCTTGDGDVSVTLGGSPTTPATATCSSGAWTLTLSSPIAGEGSYVFAASQTDALGNTGGSGDVTVTITAAPSDVLTPTDGSPLTATEGVVLRNAVLGTFTDSNTAATVSSFTAEVCWDDGSACAPATVSGTAGRFTVRGTHTFGSPGAYDVVTTITPASGSAVEVHTAITVGQAALKAGSLKVTLDKAKTSVTVAATFTDANPNGVADDYKPATIEWGDGTSDSGAIVNVRTGVWTVGGTHHYAAAGTYTITIRIDHAGKTAAIDWQTSVRIR